MTLKQNIFFVAGKSILVDLIGDVIYFPIWWYTAGFFQVLKNFARNIKSMASQLALRLLVLNIFKPMFAQYDRAGRIISFFMRIVILVGRAVYFMLYLIVQTALVLVWLLLPIVAVLRLIDMYLNV